jgi:DNA-binding NtrC family response regulator
MDRRSRRARFAATFYRLNVFPIAVPALHERADDIPLLAEYFIDRYSRKAGKTIRHVNKRTLDHLRSYPWPGMVRELQNVIERSVIVCDTEEFTVDQRWVSARPLEGPLALAGTLAAHEKVIIEEFVVQRFDIGEISPMAGRSEPFRLRDLRWPADCGAIDERSCSD